jgi:hypothetical protein
MRPWFAVIAVGCAIVLGGCATSDRDRVAQRLEAYAHSVAAGDSRGACDAFTPTQRAAREPHCGQLSNREVRIVAEARTPTIKDAKAARIRMDGDDRATGYLRIGDCVLRATRTDLTKDKSGTWRMEDFSITRGQTGSPMSRCIRE